MSEINSERYAKFVSTSNSEIEEEDEYTDEQAIFADQAAIFFLEWYPHYLKSRKSEYEDMISREDEIIMSGERKLKMKLNFMKLIFRYEKMMDIINMLLSEQNEYYQRYFPENSTIREEVAKGLSHSQMNFCKTLIEKIYKRRYPMIWYYSTDEGMKMWFTNRNTMAYWPTNVQREYQYYEGTGGDKREILSTLNTQTTAALRGEVTDQHSARRKIVAIYKTCMMAVYSLFGLEFMHLQIFRPDLNYEGVVYRGETMTESELRALQVKVNNLPKSSPYHSFSYKMSSFSKCPKIAYRFLQSIANNKKKILHKIYLVKPKVEDLNEFSKMFPDQVVYQSCISIDKLSIYPLEKEVLCDSNMETQFLNIEEKDGIWTIESMAPLLNRQGTTPLFSNENRETGTDWLEFQKSIVKRNSSRVAVLKERNPSYVSRLYIDYLNRLSIAQSTMKYCSPRFESEHIKSHETEISDYICYLKSFITDSN